MVLGYIGRFFMKSFTDKLTKEKIYEYRVDDSGDFADAQSEASGKDVKIIVNMRKCGNVFRRGLNVKSAEGNFASINLGYPHCFKCIDKAGAEHDYVFGLNAENKLAFYDFTSAGTFVGTLSDVTLTKPPILIDYNYDGQNYLLINCGEKGFYVYDNEFTKLGANPLVTGAVIYDGKLFACSSDNYPRVRYCAMFNPKTWSGSQTSLYVYNECGMVRGLVNLKNYIYVFQDNGISRISKADSENYTVTKICETGEKAYGSTVRCSGDAAWFFTSRGLYRFDGSKLENKSDFLGSAFIGGEQSQIVAFHGKTYVATRLVFPSDVYSEQDEDYAGNNALIVFGEDKAEVYCGYKIKSFCPLYEQDKLILAMDDGSMRILSENDFSVDQGDKAVYELNESDFGYTGNKCVKAVDIMHEGAVTVELCADGKKYLRSFDTGNSARRILFNAPGRKFSLRIISDGKALSSPVIYYSEGN